MALREAGSSHAPGLELRPEPALGGPGPQGRGCHRTECQFQVEAALGRSCCWDPGARREGQAGVLEATCPASHNELWLSWQRELFPGTSLEAAGYRFDS